MRERDKSNLRTSQPNATPESSSGGRSGPPLGCSSAEAAAAASSSLTAADFEIGSCKVRGWIGVVALTISVLGRIATVGVAGWLLKPILVGLAKMFISI